MMRNIGKYLIGFGLAFLLMWFFTNVPEKPTANSDVFANKLFVEAVQLINSAEGKTNRDSIKCYEEALKIFQEIINYHSESDVAVRLVSREALIAGKSMKDIKAHLTYLKSPSRRKPTPEEKVAGTYEFKKDAHTFRFTFLPGGVAECWEDDVKGEEGAWMIKDGNIQATDDRGKTLILGIESDGDLTAIALINRDGTRKEVPKGQLTFKKLHSVAKFPGVHPRRGFTITSKPIGARVVLGDEVPQLTPANFDAVAVGNYPIIISKRGFKEVRKEVKIENNKFFDLGEVLLEHALGGLKLNTTPKGMEYELIPLEKDPELKSLTSTLPMQGKTPTVLEKVPVGKYRVIFRRVGWRDVVHEMDVADGNQPVAKGDFPQGILKVESNPPGANITIDGQERGIAPVEVPLPPGKYMVAAAYKNMAPRAKQTTVEVDEKSVVTFNHGTVRVIADPEDSVVTINGEEQDKSPIEIMLPVGDIAVSIKYKDWPALDKNGILKTGETEMFRVGYNYGNLTITSDPPGAIAVLDGKEIGKTPLKKLWLAGEYKVAVKFDISESEGQTVRIRNGEQVETNFKGFLKPRTILWKFLSGGTVTSAPAIGRDGTIYFGEKTWGELVLAAGTGKVYALNPDGTKKWDFVTGDGVTTDPAIGSDGTVYVESEDGKFYALDGKTGEKIWNFQNKNGARAGLLALNSVNTSPAIGPYGTIFLGPEDGNIYALDGKTGGPKWFISVGGRSFGFTPAPSIGSDGTLYIGTGSTTVLAIHGSTGKRKWGRKLETEFGLEKFSVQTSSAIGNDGTVYVGAHPNKVFAFNGKTGDLRWQFDTGEKPAKVRFTPPVIGVDGTVYVGTDNNKVFALAGTTGRQKWNFSAQSGVRATPVVGTDGVLYVITSGINLKFADGKFIDPKSKIIALDVNSGAKKWDREMGDMTLASPTMGHDGTLYIGGSNNQDRGRDVVYAIYTGSKGPAKSPWPMRGQNPQHTGSAPKE